MGLTQIMATVKKGILTSAPQWAKHLRPYWKGVFWSSERKAAQADVAEQVQMNQVGEDRMPMTTEVTLVTPLVAEQWLNTNKQNRRLRPSLVAQYAQAMEAGEWKVNGEAIVFGASGRLLDGQHRLSACMHTGKPFASVVVRGVDDTAFDTIDQGLKRQPGDIIDIRYGGAKYPNVTAHAARLLAGYESNKLERSISRVTPVQMLAMVEKYPEVIEAGNVGHRVHRLLPAGVAAFMYTLMVRIDRKDADVFFEHLRSGQNLSEDDPVLRYRNRLIDDRWDKTHHIANVEKIRAGFNAWNMMRGGLKTHRLPSAKRGAENLPALV
jgi:hypothetical protein